MTHATKIDGAWAPVYPGIPFVDATGISRPGNWLDLASDAEKDAAEVYAVPDPDPPPAGKVEASRDLVGEDRPRWATTYQDAPPPAPEPVPETISDRQFAQALAKLDPPVITQAEALAFVKRGEVPEALQAVIDSVEDPDERFDLDMAVSGATLFDRSNPSTVALAAALHWSPEQMDALWRFAATIR